MTSSSSTPARIAVLGLGPMGAAIAGTLARAGHDVTAWNRTTRPFAELAGDGVSVVDQASAAVDPADVVVICVRDHVASRRLLEQTSVGDAVVVNVSTGTPAEAVESARLAASAGVRYVTGAVMVPTPLVGTPANLVLYAGDRDVVAAATAVLSALGGTADDIGPDHAVPPALDLAMLDVYFAGIYAFLHSTALVGRHGVDPARYLPYAEAIVDSVQASLPQLADAATRRRFDSGQARLDMCLAFLEKIVASSDEVGVRSDLPASIRDASLRALTHHGADRDWDVVVEELLTAGPAA